MNPKMSPEKRNFKVPIVVLTIAAYLLFSFAPLLEAQGSGYKSGKDLEQIQRKNVQIDDNLAKARKEREVHNYKKARAYGERALKIDPNGRMAKAFLDQLAIEEKRYADYLQAIKERKEEEKRLKKDKKRLEKEAKKKKKEPSKEIKPEEVKKEIPKKKKLTKKEIKEQTEIVAGFIEESEKALSEEQYERARTYAERALILEKDNKAAQDLLKKINEISPPEERPVGKKPVKVEGGIAELSKPGQPIIVDGDKVEYFETDGTIIADGNVSITYGDTLLTCNRIEVNTRTRQAVCEGNVRIVQTDGILEGERIRYDFAQERGEIIGGEVKAFPWFASAAESAKVGENEYLLKQGHFTTCDLDEPHYKLKAKQIQIFPNDKIIAKNVVAYIGKVPVFWVPYYYHPIVQSRAKVQFIPGVTGDWGFFLLSAWRSYIKGNTKVDVLVDYRTRKGFAAGADLYYNFADFGLEGLGYGLLRGYFIDQNGFGVVDPTPYRDGTKSQKMRRRYKWNHRIDFDPRTVGILELNKYSDEFVLKDYYYNEYEEASPIPNNFISIVNTQPNYTFSFLANTRLNNFYTVVERMPELKIDIPDQRLWDTSLYYGAQMSGTIFQKEYRLDTSPHENVGRWDWLNKFSYVTGIGPVSIVPFATIRQTVYSRKEFDNSPAYRAIFGGGVDVFSRFHKVYNLVTDFAGLDINGLRHIIVPRAAYFHTEEPSVYQGELYKMDGIDYLDRENKFSFSLENKFQTKRLVGSELRSTDLVRSIISVDYHFRTKKNMVEFQGPGQFRDLKFDIELRPYEWLYVDTRTEIKPKNMSIGSSSIEATFFPWDTFSMALGYRYEKREPEPRNQVTFDLYYILTPKWRVELYGRYDLHTMKAEEQQISIVRDLHCWEVEATYDVDGSNFFSDGVTFWLAFKIKAFPDLPIGLNRSFEKRAPGAMR